VDVIARQTIACPEGPNMLTQFALFAFKPLRIWLLRRQLDEKAFDQGRDRSVSLGRPDSHSSVNLFLHRNCDIFHMVHSNTGVCEL